MINMNWYSEMKKVAFPYGRIKCPSCRKMFANDFGFKDMSEGESSTQKVSDGKLPFVDYEKKKYDAESFGIASDEVERGTIVVSCPVCSQHLEVEYEWDTGSPEGQSPDFFSQVKVTDIQIITPEMSNAYKNVGMTSGMGIAEASV